MIEIGHISHPGKKRSLNEDSYDVDAVNRLALVVDGMGGLNAGDVAGAFVREQTRKCLLQGDAPAEALKNAGQALRIQRPQQGGSPSGASAIALRFDDDNAQLAWVGTCRAFLCDGRQVAIVRADGDETAPGKGAGHGSAIQALGVTASEKLCIAATCLSWRRGSALLLCSDGLLEECDTARLRPVLCDPRLSAQEAVEQLLALALQGEAGNNLTAVLLRKA